MIATLMMSLQVQAGAVEMHTNRDTDVRNSLSPSFHHLKPIGS